MMWAENMKKKILIAAALTLIPCQILAEVDGEYQVTARCPNVSMIVGIWPAPSFWISGDGVPSVGFSFPIKGLPAMWYLMSGSYGTPVQTSLTGPIDADVAPGRLVCSYTNTFEGQQRTPKLYLDMQDPSATTCTVNKETKIFDCKIIVPPVSK